MATKNQRKYKCRDCGETRLVHWVELNRAASARCHGCGGFMEPHSEGALADRVSCETNFAEHSDTRGDLIRCRR